MSWASPPTQPLPPEYRAGNSGRGISAFLFAAAMFLLFVGLSGLGLWGIGRLLKLDMRSRQAARDGFLAAWETPAERQASYRAAFASEDMGASSGELREFDRLFQRVRSACRGDDEAFRKLVDDKAFASRVLSHPAAQQATNLQKRSLDSNLEGQIVLSGYWNRHQVMHIERGTREGEALAYVLFDNWDGDGTVYRFWLRREGRAWKICDWQRSDLRLSHCAIVAHVVVLDNDPDGDGYHLTMDAASEEFSGDRATQVKQLLALVDAPLPVGLHDYCKLLQAYSWQELGRPRQALACLAAIQEPDAWPGVYHVRAIIHAEREEHAEALAAADKCLGLVGFDPAMLRLKAESLTALGRHPEAKEAWFELARRGTDHVWRLRSLAQVLADDEQQKLVELVQKTADPLQLASTIAFLAQEDGNEAGYAVLERFITEQAPESQLLDALHARRLSSVGDPLAAAKIYWRLQKAEEDTDEKDTLRFYYLAEMCAGGAAAEAYERLVESGEDAAECFQEIAKGTDDEEGILPFKDLPPLMAAHRKRAPNDPWLLYYEGLLLVEQGDDAAAERKFAAAQKQSPASETPADDNGYGDVYGSYDDLHYMPRDARIRALARLGRWQKAMNDYQSDPDIDAFSLLAETLQAERHFDDLEQLVESTQATEETAALLTYYRAVIQMQRKQYAAAAWLLERKKLGDDETWLSYQYDNLKTDAYLAAGAVDLAYRVEKDRRVAFERLYRTLLTRRRYDQLQRLIAIHRSADPNDPKLLEVEVELDWAKLDYAAVIDGLTPWPAEVFLSLEPYRLAQLHEWKVRSLLASGNVEQAKVAAEEALKLDDASRPLLLLELFQGETENARRLLANRPLARETLAGDSWNDPVLKALFVAPEFAELREQFPPADPTFAPTAEVVLLARKPLELTAEQIAERLRLAGLTLVGDWQTIDFSLGKRRSTLFHTSLGMLIVTVGEGLYPLSRDVVSLEELSQQQQRALKSHGGWVAFDFERSSQVRRSLEALPAIEKAVAAFCNEDTRAICASAGGADSKIVVLDDAASGGQLPAGELFADDRDRSNNTWWGEYPYQSDDALAARKRESELQKFLHGLERHPAPIGAKVKISLHRGHAYEELWLDVSKANRGEYGSFTLEGHLQGGSALFPHLPAGSIISVDEFDIREWPEH